MLKTYTLLVITLFYAFVANAQKEKLGLKEHDSYSGYDYVPGRLLVKLKPEFRSIFNEASKKSSKTRKTFQSLKLRSEPLYHQKYIRKRNRRANNPSGVDVSLFHTVQYSRNIPLAKAIDELKALDIFEYVEPDIVYQISYEPSDSRLSEQYYLESTRAFEAWDITRGDSAIIIGVADSGTDIAHVDIVNKLQINEDEIPDNGIDDDENGYIDDVNGWDFAGADTLNPLQDNDPNITKGGFISHGTWVSGSAAADTDNEIGIAGIGFNCKLITTKHTSDNQREDDSGVFNPYGGVIYFTEMGVDVMNLSWGGPFRSDIAQEIINVAALDEDIVVVAAAGNAGSFAPEYPASYENVISVAAIDENDERASFTNRGRTIDLAAPGVGILTTSFPNDYSSVQGTSFAAPIVAGAAGLLRTHFPNFTAKQIAKQLRVNANPSIYENTDSNPRTLGLGKLDIAAALSNQRPGIEFEDIQILNTQGSTNIQTGDTVLITGTFRNYLFDSSPQLRAELILGSPFVSVLDNTFTLGPMEAGQEISNAQQPFVLVVANFSLEDLELEIRFDFIDTEYYDYQFQEININPSIVDIERNLVSTSMPNNGRFGYKDFNGNQGLGFVFEEINVLFEMGLMMGTSANDISSAVRSDTLSNGQGSVNEHFVSTSSILTRDPGERSVFEVSGSMDNRRATTATSELAIDYRSLVYAEDPHDQYVILEYDVTNTGSETLEDFYAGLYADWDIGSRDSADWNSEYRLGYIFNTNAADTIFAGIQVLTGTPNYYPINNNQEAPGSPFGVYDGFTDEEKFISLSSGDSITTHTNMPPGDANDMSHTVGAGPYTVAAGETIRLAFAIHAAGTLDDILRSAEAADERYNRTLPLEKPTLSFTPACIGSPIEIEASGGTTYRWYAEQFGGEPFFEGTTYTTTPLQTDSTLYVSQVVDGIESLRETVAIRMRANPELTVSGRTRLCEGDTTFLIAKQADSYLWNNGATTRTLAVTETGNYSVTVTDNTFDCSNTSEEVTILVDELPQAAFSLPFDSLDIRQNAPVQITDLSTNAVAWEWDFGNGQTSNEQNPTINFDDIGDFSITLTATSASGCSSTTTEVFSVTSLENRDDFLAGILVFPNPNQGVFEVELSNEDVGEVSFQLTNINGQKIRREVVMKRSTQLRYSLSITELPAGIYVLRAQQGDKFSITRIVKQN